MVPQTIGRRIITPRGITPRATSPRAMLLSEQELEMCHLLPPYLWLIITSNTSNIINIKRRGPTKSWPSSRLLPYGGHTEGRRASITPVARAEIR